MLIIVKHNRMKKIIVRCAGFFAIAISLSFTGNGSNATAPMSEPPFLTASGTWVDSVFNSLTTDQKLGQLFMVAAYSNKDTAHISEITKLIKTYNIGGLIFMQGGPVRQAKLTNYYQSMSKTPLMISIDAEWGLAMRLDSTMSFPKQMCLGAIQNDSLIYQMGRMVAQQCKRIGVTINFAPVIDVNNNPANPVIGIRSFGENKYNVAHKGIMYMKGMQDEHVFTTGKHFPGHGDTNEDSHLSLPLISHSKQRLDSLELYPFKQLIAHGLNGIMVAHLQVPALEKSKNTATTLSANVVTKLLKQEMGFKGLVFTDALNMKGVSKFNKPGDVDYRALKAGNDVLLFSENVPLAIEKIKQGMIRGDIDSNQVFASCKKILQAKRWMNLNTWKPIDINTIDKDLHSPEAQLLYRRLVEASITTIKTKNNIVPLKRLDTLKIAALAIGDAKVNEFQKRLASYTNIKTINIAKNAPDSVIEQTIQKLQKYNLVIISLHGTSIYANKKFGISEKTYTLINRLAKIKPVILTLFTSPYALASLQDVTELKGIVIGYEDSPLYQDYAAQAIFGGIRSTAKVPVTVPGKCKEGEAVLWNKSVRLKYSTPDDVGMNSDTLQCIDEIIDLAIKNRATPGCQVLIAKDNAIIFQKSYGYHTYKKLRAVKDSDIYDIASITKITATSASLMKLSDEGLFNVNNELHVYLPELDSTNKAHLRIIDILTHQAGLKPWIPFFLSLIEGYDVPHSGVASSKLSRKYDVPTGVAGVWLDSAAHFSPKALQRTADTLFSIKVADNLYINKHWKDSIFNKIARSKVSSNKSFVYSDLGYYFMQRIIEKQTHTSLDSFAQKTFYDPLGASTLGYLPLKRFEKDRIVPTELDYYFRKQLLQGNVHDPGGAMMGGVAGHAGIFSSANDLAKLLQMYLNKGEYGGERYLSDSILTRFTSCAFCPQNHRGITFDKPGVKQSIGPVCWCVPPSSYGHTGFTGTIVWIDPDNELIYIFLSNRVCPDAENQAINKLAIRQAVQQTIYNSFLP